MSRKGMVIDLKRCNGCHACTVACKAENATPPGVFWGRVLEQETGKYPTPKRTFLPVLCNHCQNAPCVKVCPTGASSQREDGLVLVDYQKCIGCRACVTACPYQSRYYLKEIHGYYGDQLTPYEQVGYSKFETGTVQKCTLCAHRVDRGLDPACVQTCPTKCRTFGDLDDPSGELAHLMRDRYVFRLRADLGTDPSVCYIS